MAKETTAAELIEAGVRPATAAQRLRQTVLERLKTARDEGQERTEAFQALVPRTVLDLEALETLVAGLVAGAHTLLLGPPGAGKTTLARELWELMPKDVFVVKGSPVQDDPFSLVDPAYARIVPPSPVVVSMYGDPQRPGEVDPANVPVVRTRLREGHGLARVQGSPEVFPDNLTGTIDLARLEEIGDPTSPLVLAPGKLLQAHRGLLLVDEVGKLPRGTQNVLLQALQERTVSAAKSRETFPADVVAVTTSNVHDLGNITEPLTDRLANVHIGFPTSPEANRRIVDMGLDGAQVPGPYRDAAVRIMLRWRAQNPGGDELSEVSSNRTLIDILRRAWSHSLISGDPAVAPDDLRRGARDAMSGRVRARSADGYEENRDHVHAFVEEHWEAAAREGAQAYWCRFFQDELKGDQAVGVAVVKAVREADPGALQTLTRKEGGDPHVRRFARFVQAEEGLDREGAVRVLPEVHRALEELGAFEA